MSRLKCFDRLQLPATCLKLRHSLGQNGLGLSIVVLSICLKANLARTQTIGITVVPNLAQTRPLPPTSLPQNVIPPPSTSPAPLPAPVTPAPPSPPSNLLHPSSPPLPTSKIPGTVPGTIIVTKFRFIGNTAFSRKTLTRLLIPFTNQPITLAQLFKASSAVTQLYVDHGYITSGAFLPPQILRGGVITIRIVEGKLEKIQVTGTRRLSPNYVRSRIAIAASGPLNRNRLLKALQLLQLNPLIKHVSANLSAGTVLGSSILEIQVAEAKTFTPQLIIDNNRPSSVGSFERGLQVNEANLLGLGDGLSVGYTNSKGSNNVDASYTLPLNPRNGTLNLSYGNTWSHVVEPPFNQLDINANFRYYDVTLRQPVLQTPSQELALGLVASRRESDVSFLGSSSLGQIISPGADNRGRTRISAIRLFQEWTHQNSREVTAARSQFSFGVGALNATIHATAPDSHFFTWQGQGQLARLLAPDTLLLVRADIQLASSPLVPLEQFGLGGEETVRGYAQDFLLTDNAVFGSVEVRLPIYRAPSQQTLLQLAPFFDAAGGWNNRGNTQQYSNTPNTLLSLGIGLRLQLGNNVVARFDYGVPLVNDSVKKRTWQENGFYFSLQVNPF